MKLHGNLVSPFSRMCMVTAIECGLSMRVQLVQAMVKPDEVNKQLEAMSPLGKLPVLELDNGKTLYDSRVIMEYFCALAGNTALLPATGNVRFAVLTALALAEGMGDACAQLRYETGVRPPEKHWPGFADRLRLRIGAVMDSLERQLPELNVAGIAFAVVLSYIDVRSLMPDWRNTRPALAAWHEEFTKRSSMASTQPRL